ncbi:MAG: hypothetical protein A2Y10_12920 [Planctomycetes bacterium GWF2_41_51]|nr:MAG: hypothetical protein A2Y10_12920 [Planctomycetes bacterium GWF2_41_51]
MKFKNIFAIIMVASAISQAASIYDDAAAYWIFYEDPIDDQIIFDSTSNGNDLCRGFSFGIDDRDASWRSAGASGFRGTSIRCYKNVQIGEMTYTGFVSSGSGIEADLTDLNIIGDQSFTIAVWAKATNPDTNKGMPFLLSKMQSSGDLRGWALSIRDVNDSTEQDKVEFYLRSTNSFRHRLWVKNSVKLRNFADTRRWTHYAITYDGGFDPSGVHIYVNGTELQKRINGEHLTVGDATDCNKPFNICARNNVSQGFADVDETAVWHRQLSAVEVQQCVNEALPVNWSHTGGNTTVDEATISSDTINIALNGPPTSDVTVTIEGNSLFNFGSGIGNSHNVVLNAANPSATVTVTAAQNYTPETVEPYFINLTSSSGDTNFNGVYILPLVVSYVDDDTARVIVTSATPPALMVHEQGETIDTFTVSLAKPPTADVNVAPSFDAQFLRVTPSNYIFTASDYSTPKTFTVQAIDNTFLNTQLVYYQSINFTVASSDLSYEGLSVPTLQAGVYDNDCGTQNLILPGDINTNCRIDLADFAIFAENWFICSFPDTPGCTN